MRRGAELLGTDKAAVAVHTSVDRPAAAALLMRPPADLVVRTVALLGCIWLSGCIRNRGREAEQTRAAATMPDELPADKEGSLTVSLRALLVTGKTDRPLLENETLHAGDHLYFLLRTSQPAYLYVVLFGPDGKSSVLFPRGPEGKARGRRYF